MTVYRPPSLDKAAPIVSDDGRPSVYFQRFWQNLSFTAADGANQASSIAALQTTVATHTGQISALTTTVAGKVAKSSFASYGTPSGILTRTTFATYVAPTISASPTLAEVQAIADHVQKLSERLAALITDIK